ncbi:unnamed protein product, partial [Discosporangium mesarthrocarpum]
MYMDKQIGNFMDLLEENGWLENSIVVVASDNGGCPGYGGSNYPLRGIKHMYFEGGSKVPALVYSRSHIPVEMRGTTYDSMMHVTDWLPTLLTASVGSANISGSAGALDGVNHWSAMTSMNNTSPRTELLYNWDPYQWSRKNARLMEYAPKGAFRSGKWKFISREWCTGWYSFDNTLEDKLLDMEACPKRGECSNCGATCVDSPEYIPADWLFNLEEDPREQHNLIDDYPHVANLLRARADEIAMSEW